jgi:malonate-semialdehyde dehydrogenase (acetylating)/methylmalonate-semialdehyde dehydrogenase
MTSFFGNAGQRCLAGANALVVGRDDDFYREFVADFKQAAAAVTLGHGLDHSTQMGPLQADFRKQNVINYIEKGLSEGARLVLDGRDPSPAGDTRPDCFLAPCIFENVKPDMTIAREEIFGPVASILRADDLDQAIAMVNALPYGNMASIFTSSGKNAREFSYRVQTGNVGINIGIAAPMAFFPFSGMKESFFGVLHGQGKDAVRFFTETKVVIERWF